MSLDRLRQAARDAPGGRGVPLGSDHRRRSARRARGRPARGCRSRLCSSRHMSCCSQRRRTAAIARAFELSVRDRQHRRSAAGLSPDAGRRRRRRSGGCTMLRVRSDRDRTRDACALERSPSRPARARVAGRRGARVAVLRKRAISSASSLARTVQRRLDQLGSTGRARRRNNCRSTSAIRRRTRCRTRILTGPCPRCRTPRRERRLLTALADSRGCTPARRRTNRRSPRSGGCWRASAKPALVFTEFRDTLLHLRDIAVPVAASPARRPLATSGRRILRASRAATQASCSRPTRPARASIFTAAAGSSSTSSCRGTRSPRTAIGRVDRIGQRRRVHAFHLIASDTGERRRGARRLLPVAARRASGILAAFLQRTSGRDRESRLRTLLRAAPTGGAPGLLREPGRSRDFARSRRRCRLT